MRLPQGIHKKIHLITRLPLGNQGESSGEKRSSLLPSSVFPTGSPQSTDRHLTGCSYFVMRTSQRKSRRITNAGYGDFKLLFDKLPDEQSFYIIKGVLFICRSFISTVLLFSCRQRDGMLQRRELILSSNSGR